MARPSAPLLSKDRIRKTALALIDEAGLDGMSMRKLAGALDVKAASLYFHYPTKENLLDDIGDELMEQVDTSGFAEDWQTGLLAWARSYRAALAAHPNFVPFLAYGPGHRDASLRRANAVHGGLVGAGWPPREATMIGASTKYLVIGAAMGSFSQGFIDDVQVYVDRYPSLHEAHLLREHAAEVDRDSFEFALQALLAGLNLRYEAIENQRERRRAAARRRTKSQRR